MKIDAQRMILKTTSKWRMVMTCLLFCLANWALAEKITLSENQHFYTVENKIEYLIDYSKKLTIADISNNTNLPFQIHPNTILNFDAVSTPIWLKLTINNPLDNAKELFIQIEYAWISQIDFYEPQADHLKKITTGVDYPNSSKPVESRSYAFPVTLSPKSEKTFFIKINNRYLTRMPMSVSTKEKFTYNERVINIISGTYYGLMIAMFAYNLFLLISVRDAAYFFYVCSIFFSVSYQAAHGAIHSILFPNAIWWNQNAILVSAPMILVCMIQFGRSFLHTKYRLPRFDRFLFATLIISLLFMIFAFTPYGAAGQKVIAIFALLTIVSQLTAGILVYRQGYKPAIYYILAYSSFVGFSTIVPAAVLGIIPYGPFVAWTYQIGSALETILLSLALADRINTLKKEKFDSLKQVAEATAKSEAKSDFLAKMSHEIRTPMNGVLGMATLLNATKLDATQKYYTNAIQNSGKALLNVINDVLDLSKIEAKKIALEHIHFKLSDVIDECASVFTSTASEKNIAFFCNTKPNVPDNLIGDPARVRQILLNLISNAFKFTTHGSITVTIESEKPSQHHVILKFIVKDTGIGIEPEVQSQLFQSFIQADSSITRRYGGTGLGLTICKQLAELMHGNIGVESIPKHGSKFWFTVTIDLRKTQHSLENVFDFVNLKLITNSPIFRALINEHARFWGMETFAPKPSELIEQVNTSSSKRKELIIIDLDTTKLDSEFLAKLSEINNDAALLYFTRLHNIDYLNLPQKALDQTAQIPNTSNQLYLIIKMIIFNKKLIKPFEEINQQLQKYFKNKSVLIAEDNQTNQIVIQGMLRKLGIESVSVENGEEAIETIKSNHSFDLIFMDCEMPVMDGYTATKKIREFETTHQLESMPIIALTAHALQEHRKKSLESGMNDHLSKPIVMTELIKMIAKWLHIQLDANLNSE